MGWGGLSKKSNVNISKEWPIHQPTHHTYPPNHTSTHRWRSLDRLQICKQNWFILISSRHIKFILFQGGPPLAGRGGWGWGWVVSVLHLYTYACTCTHVCMHKYICTHIPIHVNHDKHGCLHGSGHLQFLNM